MSPRVILPNQSVPVTTVPAPLIVKTRSMWRTVDPSPAFRPGRRPATRLSASATSPTPAPVRADDDSETREELAHLGGRPIGIGPICLGDCDHALVDAEAGEDDRVLLRLRHHPVVGGDDDDQEEVDAPRAGDHSSDEPFVSGDVDHRDLPTIRQAQTGIAQLDRDPPGLLFRQPVGVDAGERGDERRLAMVDVTGRTQREGWLPGAHRRRA